MKRLPMRKIREVLRLAASGMSTRQIAASLSVGRTTLREYLGRTQSADLSWPLPDDLTDMFSNVAYTAGVQDGTNIVWRGSVPEFREPVSEPGFGINPQWQIDNPDGFQTTTEVQDQIGGTIRHIPVQAGKAEHPLFDLRVREGAVAGRHRHPIEEGLQPGGSINRPIVLLASIP